MLLTRFNTALGNPFTQTHTVPSAQASLGQNPAIKPAFPHLHQDVFFSARLPRGVTQGQVDAQQADYDKITRHYERTVGSVAELEKELRSSKANARMSQFKFQQVVMDEIERRSQPLWGSGKIWPYFDEISELPEHTTQQQDQAFGKWLACQSDKAQRLTALSEAFQKKHGQPYAV